VHVENLVRIIKIPMDKADAKNTNLIDNTIYVLVLTKLKHILVNGFYSMDEVRYIYEWDDTKPKEENLKQARKEDAVLRYFLDIGVFGGRRFENEFRSQELQARRFNPDARVWADWDKVDAPYREYEWAVELHSIDYEKFIDQLNKFHLVDTGIGLDDSSKISNTALPAVVSKVTDEFSVHESNLISYKGRLIELEPQVGKIVALVMERSVNGQYTSSENIVDECLSEEYLAKAEKSDDEDLVFKYVRRCVSDARSSFRAAAKSKKDKNFFPNKAGVGYTFVP
jgi:hypothetical protein